MDAAPAGEVWFYHLERSSIDEVLPGLLERTLARGWRAVVRVPDLACVERLDARLWTFRDDSFLPHGPAGGAHDARQPILLTTEAASPNGAEAAFAVEGAEPWDVASFERSILLFDGADETALAAARERWRALKASGAPVTYWRQKPEGGWEKQG